MEDPIMMKGNQKAIMQSAVVLYSNIVHHYIQTHSLTPDHLP